MLKFLFSNSAFELKVHEEQASAYSIWTRVSRKVPKEFTNDVGKTAELTEFLAFNDLLQHHKDLIFNGTKREDAEYDPDLGKFFHFMMDQGAIDAENATLAANKILAESFAASSELPKEAYIFGAGVAFVLFGVLRLISQRITNARCRPKVVEIYEKHNPQKLKDVAQIMSAYMGREQELLELLTKTYIKSEKDDKGTDDAEAKKTK